MKPIKMLLTALLCVVLASSLAACGSSSNNNGGHQKGTAPVTVSALYPNNGANWNDYVKNDGGAITNATDTVCDASTDTSCLNGGELRLVEVPDESSCSSVTISDALGVFNWTCDDSTGSVRFISTGLKDGKHLSDLLDFNTPDWKKESITVTVAAGSFTTVPVKWWSNPVEVDNDGGYLNTDGTIYVVTNNELGTSGKDYIINASSAGLVIQPGAIINGPGTTSSVVSSSNRNFLWLEGDVDASGDNRGVDLGNVKFSMLDNVKAENAQDSGIALSSSSNNRLNEVTVVNNVYFGVYLSQSSNNRLSGVAASDNYYGVYLYISSNNRLSDITASNNGYAGVWIVSSSNNNTLSRVTAVNNAYDGVFLATSSNNTLSGVITGNNGYDSGVALYNNSNNNTLSGITTSNNGYKDIIVYNSSNNYFTGLLKTGGSCYVTGGTDPGLVNTTCTDTGIDNSSSYGINNSSDATLTTGISLLGSFIANVTTDDSTNTSDTNGYASYATYPPTFDWMHFDNPYRGWGPDGSFGDAGVRGQLRWYGGRIWDWSVATGDTAIKNALTPPTGDDILIHLWSAADSTSCGGIDGATWGTGVCSLSGYTDSGSCTGAGGDWTSFKCYSVFLRNAVEISGDGIGNDNLLCESGETCLYTPNIGSYQGHGNLVSAGTFVDGTLPGSITGVTLLEYDTNGR